MTNTAKLLELVKQSGMRQKFIAAQIHCTPNGWRKKLRGLSQFTQSELFTLRKLFNLTAREFNEIFFWEGDK